jgi:hypothetical protein
MKTRTTDDANLARKWACDERTIRRWRKDLAPLRDAAKMRAWLAGRKNIPLGTTALLEGLRATETATSAKQDAPLATGAAAALSRLESAEAKAFSAFVRATESGDMFAIKASRENWLKISENLRRFDLAIEEQRRDSGQLIVRSEVETALKRFGWCLRTSAETVTPHLAMQLMGETDPIRARTLIRKCNYDMSIISYSCLSAMGVPEWIRTALSTDLLTETTATKEDIERYAKVIKEAMDFTVTDRIANEPHFPPTK